MEHVFILGIHPAISAAELSALFGDKGWDWPQERILINNSLHLEAKNLIKRLGGSIKIAKIEKSWPLDTPFVQMIPDLKDILIEAKGERESKLVFGFSKMYLPDSFDVEKLGLRVKKSLAEQGISSRLVTSKDKELSSVVVGQNKLISKGAEIIFFKRGENLIAAKTLAIQDYKSLGKRDFGRPSRDDHSGMLPPKLAQIMINLLGQIPEDSLLLDPFCGSGTIINEAMLLGYSNLVGTDISPKAIEDSRANASWLRELYSLSTKANFHIKNALKLGKFFKYESIDAIVTEPYLGPQRGLHDIESAKKELEELYKGAINEFFKILKPGAIMVMLWPVFFGRHFLSLPVKQDKLVPALPDNLDSLPWVKLSPRRTLLYHRPNQKVWREIVILRKDK